MVLFCYRERKTIIAQYITDLNGIFWLIINLIGMVRCIKKLLTCIFSAIYMHSNLALS